MRETAKTSICIVLAIVTATLAIWLRPVVVPPPDMRGQILFPKFTGPSDVKTLDIVAPSHGLGDVHEFRLAEVGDFWTIPSHENYPADAKERMAQVVESLVDLKVLDVLPETETAANVTDIHAACGVIDPKGSDAAMGEGIGQRVTITGAQGEVLVDAIIGKRVHADDEAAPRRGEGSECGLLHYVRLADQRGIYIAAIDAVRFSTDFGDWIEKNLLDLSTSDVRRFYMDEYSVEMVDTLSQGRLVRRLVPTLLGDTSLRYDPMATDAKWQLDKMMSFQGKEYNYIEEPAREGEELDAELLDAMLTALGDLKIVDVAAKPASLATALREAKPLEELAEEESLDKYGFLVVQMPDPKDAMKPKVRMLSKEGDFTISLSDGTQYVLRFGEPAKLETGEGETDEMTTETTTGMSRYLLVTAQWDEASLPKPEPEQLPEPLDESADEPAKTNREAQVQTIEKQNQRELDDYEAKRDAALERVRNLNARFAPWFYVIPESVYQKIHLDRAKLFRAKTSELDSKSVSEPEETAPTVELPGGSLPGLDGNFAIQLDEPEKLVDSPAASTEPVTEPESEEPAPAE